MDTLRSFFKSSDKKNIFIWEESNKLKNYLKNPNINPNNDTIRIPNKNFPSVYMYIGTNNNNNPYWLCMKVKSIEEKPKTYNPINFVSSLLYSSVT